MHSSAAERVDGELETGSVNGIHIDDIAQIFHIGRHEVLEMCRVGAISFFKPHPSHAAIAITQKLIGPVLDPLGYVGIRRSPMRRIVFEPAILGRIVRWGDDNSVREMLSALAVMDEDGV